MKPRPSRAMPKRRTPAKRKVKAKRQIRRAVARYRCAICRRPISNRTCNAHSGKKEGRAPSFCTRCEHRFESAIVDQIATKE